MATPDPSKLTSSAEIFSSNHTLPQIRSIHNAIHRQVEEKSTRLRTQVGNSYRELLGTADTIVRMRADNDDVQQLLGQMGGRCGRGVVGAKTAGLADFLSKEEDSRAVESARLRLLDACFLAGSRILKGGGGLQPWLKRGDRLILATKVWVLSRLLIKSFGEVTQDTRLRKAIQSANKLLSNLRRRLVGAIDKVLRRTEGDAVREDILKALCAYSLATSSGAHDVLRHFLAVRGEAMAMAFELEEGERETSAEDVVQSLKLYAQTILDVQALVPAKLSPALHALKQRPLLADPALRQLEGLRLDIYESWMGDDINYFTPFIRHDDLDGKQARDRLSSWSKKGAEVLLQGLNKTLARMADFKSIVDLRTDVLQLWIRDGSRAKGFDPLEMQDDLRSAINDRLLGVLVSKVSKLRLVGSEVKATLEGWGSVVAEKHAALWDDTGYDTALSHGAASFVEEVVSRLYGRNDAVSKALHGYQSWYHVIDDVRDVVEMLRKQRWDNDYDEIEDEETIDARQQVLSKEDPDMLQDRLDSALDKSYKELQDQLQTLWDEKSGGPPASAIAMYLLRVLRDMREQLPDRPPIKKFGLSMVPALQSKVATAASAAPLDTFQQDGLSERTVIVRPLWEGEPPLPSQPSPEAFQLLRDLTLSMSDAGVDLWTPAAVKVMKQHLGKRLSEMWREALDKVGEEVKDVAAAKQSTNGHEEGSEDDAKESSSPQASHANPVDQRDLYVQWLFDASLLRECITSSSKQSDGLDSLLDDIYQRTDLKDEALRQRITKSSQGFWQRTSLLFGLLA